MVIAIASALDANELLAALKNIDITVPKRTEGRRTHHTEGWTICHLLSTLNQAKRLQFPVSVSHSDRPDFMIDVGTTTVGVEVTEAIQQQYAAYSALAEREYPNKLLEPAHFHHDSPMRSIEELRELLRRKKLSGKPWIGDKPEQEWALFMEGVVEAKLSKLVKPEFTKFELNWLSIYDNLALPNVNLKTAIDFLLPLLGDKWAVTPSFDVIYIEHGPVIVEITADEADHLILHDIWE